MPVFKFYSALIDLVMDVEYAAVGICFKWLRIKFIQSTSDVFCFGFMREGIDIVKAGCNQTILHLSKEQAVLLCIQEQGCTLPFGSSDVSNFSGAPPGLQHR